MSDEDKQVVDAKASKPADKLVPESQLLAIKIPLENKLKKSQEELNKTTERLRELEAEKEAGRLTIGDGTEEEINIVKRELLKKNTELSKKEQELKAREESLSERELKIKRADLVNDVRKKMKDEHGVDVPAELLTDAEDIEKTALGFVLQKLKALAQKEDDKGKRTSSKFAVGGAGTAQKNVMDMNQTEFAEYRKGLKAQAAKAKS